MDKTSDETFPKFVVSNRNAFNVQYRHSINTMHIEWYNGLKVEDIEVRKPPGRDK